MADMTELFDKCGRNLGAVSYTDGELQAQIDVTKAVIAYLRARGDAGIVVSSLRRDLDSFESYKEARKRNK